MATQNSIQASRFRAMQILLALFSFIFFFTITYGYFHLLTDFGWFVALTGGVVVALFAWFLARVAGTGEGGMRQNWVLIVPLFLVSAAGVYNSMMVYLEGGQVLSDTASDSQRRFGALEMAANTQLQASGITERRNRINSLADSLFSEIRNPLNCGQGPEARRLISEIKKDLPQFNPLTSRNKDCTQNETVVADYKNRINALIERAQWNDKELNSVAIEASKARTELSKLRAEISKSYSPSNIRQIASIFEGFQTSYQDLMFKLESRANVDSLEKDLPIDAAQSLGNIYRLPALFFSRINEPSTYVYLMIALGFDLFLVYLFQMTAKNQIRRPAIASPIAGAWDNG